MCSSGCSGNVGILNFYCTSFSIVEDWTYGSRSYNYTGPIGSFTARHVPDI